jgi:hypothetical protein
MKKYCHLILKLYLILFLNTGLIIAQNLTVKREYFQAPYGSGIHYEYQVLPDGTYHGYFKEYRSDGTLAANITKKNGKSIKGYYYFMDGKTVEREFTQNQYEGPNGIQKLNAYTASKQLFNKHISNWENGSIKSAKTLYSSQNTKFSYENNRVKRYNYIDDKLLLVDNFYIDPKNNFITGYMHEGEFIIHFNQGRLIKITKDSDTNRTLILRIAPDTLSRIFAIDKEDSTQEIQDFFDTTNNIARIYNNSTGGINISFIGFGLSAMNIIHYDNTERHQETDYLGFFERNLDELATRVYEYKYLNYPSLEPKSLCFYAVFNLETKLYEYKIYYDNYGNIKKRIVYKRRNSYNVDKFTYDSSNKLIKTEVLNE